MLKIARLIKYLYIPNKFYLNVHPNNKTAANWSHKYLQ